MVQKDLQLYLGEYFTLLFQQVTSSSW
jgi:hypothetical protein